MAGSVSLLLACVLAESPSHVQLFGTPQTIAHQAPLSIGSSRPEYWSGLPFPSPGDLPDPGIKPVSPALAGGFLTTAPPGKPIFIPYVVFFSLFLFIEFFVHSSVKHTANRDHWSLFFSPIKAT